MRTACPWPWKISNNRLAQGGAVFGGGKAGSGGTTYQTSQTTIPPEVRARYDAVNARAEQVAQQPFTPYSGQFVAPLNETQQQAIGQIGQASNAYQPYYAAATQALGQGQQAASPYYNTAGGLYGAGLGAMQQGANAAMPFYGSAAGNISQAQQAGAPYLDLATAAAQQGSRAVTPEQLQVGQFQNPYLEQVLNPTMQGLRQQQQAEQSQLMGSQAMRGAFGGDRGAIAAANLARQQDLASAQTEAGLRSQAYQQALAAAQQQQGVGLGAAQANRAAMQNWAQQAAALGQQAFQQPMAAAQAQQGLGQGLFGMGTGLGQGAMAAGQGMQGVGQGIYGMGAQSAQALQGLGAGAQQAGLAGGQALLGAGTLGQQTQQQLNAALYNQYLQQQGYPFQVAQFLANIALGTGPLYGSTTTGVTGQPTPFFSDERVKEDITEIGRTHDGQKIIKFKYKGDNTPHIGLSAQDVEKHHPEAVSETPEGIKAVDYDMATKHAERAYGGGLIPSSEGGAVHPSMAGLGFAPGGGVPVPGRSPEADKAIQDLLPKPPGLAPRAGFATAGAVTPGVDPYSQELLMSLANPMHKTMPGGGLPGGKQSWNVMQVKPQQILGANARLQAPSQPTQTGLGQAYSAVKGGLGAVEDVEKMSKYGKEAYDWIKSKMPYQGTEEGRAAYGSEAPTPSSDNPMGPRAHGGRIGYAEGGDTDDNPAIPYEGDVETNDPLKKLTAKQVTPSKLDAPALPAPGGGSKGGGGDKTASTAMKLAGLGASFIPGVGPAIGAGMNILSGLFAKGGAADDYTSIVERGESGGKNVINPASGAGGYYQFMPATWAAARRALPHLPANVMSASKAEQQEAMNWLTGEHRKALTSSLGREPTNAELRYAHYFGPSGAAALMKLDPGTRFADLPPDFWHRLGERFDTATLLRQNPNLRDETVGGLLGKYRGEFKEGFGVAPTAERIMEHKGLAPVAMPRGGLKPTENQLEDTPEIDTSEFRALDIPKMFASGGLAGRHGYQAGGGPDQLDPDTKAALDEEIRARKAADTSSPTGLAPTPTATEKPKERDFFDRAGDWYGKNQNWVLPVVSGIGKMLASPSPYLGVAIGQGIAEAAPTALAANFKQQGIDISQQRANVDTARAIQDQIWEAQGQANAILSRDPKADVSKYDQIVKRLTGKLYDLYGVSGEGLDLLKVRPGEGLFAQLHPSQNIPLLYDQLARAGGPQQRAAIQQKIDAALSAINSGTGLMSADGTQAVYLPEHILKRLQVEAAKAAAIGSGSAGGGLDTAQRAALAAQRTEIANAITAREAELQRTGNEADKQRLRNSIQTLKNLDADLLQKLGTNAPPQMPLPPGPGRKAGGRAGYQQGGNPFAPLSTEARPLDITDPSQLGERLSDPTLPEDTRKRIEEQYKSLTPEQTTPTGTKYRVNPRGGVLPEPEPEAQPAAPGRIDPRTGGVTTSPPALPYPSTGGFPRDPGLPKQPYVLAGPDVYQGTAQTTSAEQERGFLNQAASQQADINLLSTLKFANAMKILEGGGLASDKARAANMLRGLGLDPVADAIQSEKDTSAAIVAGKTALDEAIRKSRVAFASPTQSEFGRVASEATPSANMPATATISLLKENMAQQLWQDALRDDWLKARESGARNFPAFVDRWRQAHPPELFRQAADRLLGNLKGTDLPSPDKLTEGVVYVVPQNYHKHPMGELLANRGFRPGDLFVMNDISTEKDPQSGEPVFKFGALNKVEPEKGFETHMKAPGLRRKRTP